MKLRTETMGKINETKFGGFFFFLEKIDKVDKLLSRLTKRKKEIRHNLP